MDVHIKLMYTYSILYSTIYISNINIDAYIPARKLQGFDFLGREINTSNKRNSKALDLIKKYSQ